VFFHLCVDPLLCEAVGNRSSSFLATYCSELCAPCFTLLLVAMADAQGKSVELRKPQEKERIPRMEVHGVKGGPKKGGAGGKGTWGKGGIDDLKTVSEDPSDPNYSDQDEEVVLEVVDVISPIEAILKEYFLSGDAEETVKTLLELGSKAVPPQHFVRKAIVVAMEKQAYERELTSKLFSALYSKVISAEQFEQGFQIVLDKIDDVALDVPDVADVLAKFLARAVVDEIVPPAFLKSAVAETPLAKESLSLASALATEKHRIDRLAHVWGPGDLSSVKRLKQESRLLLEEYLSSGDLREADNCVRKLNAPSFHFQLVKEAVRLALDENEEHQQKILALLGFFAKEGLISPDHLAKGFACVSDALPDIKLDIPDADKRLSSFILRAQPLGWLPVSVSVNVAAAAAAAAVSGGDRVAK